MLKQLSEADRLAKFSRGWRSGLPETACGAGSKLSNTRSLRQWLLAMVEKYGIRSVVDIGAGDRNWIKKLQWDVRYTAYDLVPRSADVRRFDLINEIPPGADPVLCLWVINHMPQQDREQALDWVKNYLKSHK